MKSLVLFALFIFCCVSAVHAGEAFGEARLFDSSNKLAMALDLEGRYLYGGAGDLVVVFDVSDPLNPKKVGQVAGVGAARQLVVQNGFVYVTSREYGLWIVDATDPAHPRIRSRFDTCELATGVDVAGDVCFCGQRQNGVEFIDVSDPDHPRHIAMQKTDESQSVLYRDGYLYSGEWAASRVTVFDVHDMADIRRIRTVDLRGYGDGLWSQGRYLYASRGHHGMHRERSEIVKVKSEEVASAAADREKGGFDGTFHGMGHGLDIFDMSDPSDPKRVGTVDFPPLFARGLDMWTPRTSGDLLVAAQTHNGLIAVDISDKAHPKVIDRWVSPSKHGHYAKYPSDCVGSVAIGNGAVYAAVNEKGFFVLPCARARVEPFEQGVLPKNAGFRASYAADETQWHVWRPKDVGQVRAVAFRGDVAYVACGDAGLYLLDVLPGGGWKERCKVAGREQVYDVSVFGDRLYTAEGGKGFGVYDISGVEPKELHRLPYMVPWRNMRANLAFWTIALDETRLLCSDRKNWVLYDISHLPEFKMLKRLETSVPGWDKFVMDRAIGGHYLAFNNCHHDVRWFDTLTGDCVAKTKRNCTTLLNGICAFGSDSAVYTRGGGVRLLKPLEVDPSDGSLWQLTDVLSAKGLPRLANGRRMHPGMPRSDGRLVAFTKRIDRYATLFDFADPEHPVALGGWQFKGNPDVAAFHKGRLAIPCGYEGLLMRK